MKISELGKVLTSLSNIHGTRPSDTKIEELYFDADTGELTVSTEGNNIVITATMHIIENHEEEER